MAHHCPNPDPLYKAILVKASRDIQKLIMTQMDYREQGKVLDLIQDLEIESSLWGDYIHENTKKQQFCSFSTTALNGKLCSEVFCFQVARNLSVCDIWSIH